jgi:hypothetical protein
MLRRCAQEDSGREPFRESGPEMSKDVYGSQRVTDFVLQWENEH